MRVVIEKSEDGVISVTREIPGEEVEMLEAASVNEAIDIAQGMLMAEPDAEQMWDEEAEKGVKAREMQDSYE